jgi:hypothetical protein
MRPPRRLAATVGRSQYRPPPGARRRGLVTVSGTDRILPNWQALSVGQTPTAHRRLRLGANDHHARWRLGQSPNAQLYAERCRFRACRPDDACVVMCARDLAAVGGSDIPSIHGGAQYLLAWLTLSPIASPGYGRSSGRWSGVSTRLGPYFDRGGWMTLPTGWTASSMWRWRPQLERSVSSSRNPRSTSVTDGGEYAHSFGWLLRPARLGCW